MHPFAAFAVRTIGAVAATAVLSTGAVVAAAPSPNPSAGSSSTATANHSDRRIIVRAVIEAEADILKMRPVALVKALKDGEEVSELARAKGLNKAEFTARLLVNLTLRLERLVDHKVITREEARKVLAHIANGNVPFWNGIHDRM